VKQEELRKLMIENLMDSAQVAEALKCSRANVDDLVRRKKLIPIYASSKARLFLRADVLARLKQD